MNKKNLPCIRFSSQCFQSHPNTDLEGEIMDRKPLNEFSHYSMTSLATMDSNGYKLDWTEYEYDHTDRSWAIGLNTGDGK